MSLLRWAVSFQFFGHLLSLRSANLYIPERSARPSVRLKSFAKGREPCGGLLYRFCGPCFMVSRQWRAPPTSAPLHTRTASSCTRKVDAAIVKRRCRWQRNQFATLYDKGIFVTLVPPVCQFNLHIPWCTSLLIFASIESVSSNS